MSSNLSLDQETDLLVRLAKVFGIVFLSAGIAALIVLLIWFVQVISDPHSVSAISMFADFLESDAPPITVTVEGREAVVDFDPTLRAVLVVFFGALSLIAVGSVLNACIGSGLKLLNFANKKPGSNGN